LIGRKCLFKELRSKQIEKVKYGGANRRVVSPLGQGKKLIATFKAMCN